MVEKLRSKEEVIIIGGGLAGLVAAHRLRDHGLEVLLVEKKTYPFHRVCGEYISNETRPFLESSGLYPHQFSPAEIRRLIVTAPSGRKLESKLDTGGFGISRFALDYHWYLLGLKKGIRFCLKTSVEDVLFSDGLFQIRLSDDRVVQSRIVLGCFGKRSKLDMTLQRDFVQKHSPYIGIKYHVKYDFPEDVVSLHNFQDGYCGLNKVEGEVYNLCYLTTRDNLRKSGDIPSMEQNILQKNVFLKKVWAEAGFVSEKPLVINEISFGQKKPVENHVVMIGDAAGLIAPLCGNGMAMAIHGAKIAVDLVLFELENGLNRHRLEDSYTKIWNATFRRRLWFGRKLQGLFGRNWVTNIAVSAVASNKPLANWLIRQTHGPDF